MESIIQDVLSGKMAIYCSNNHSSILEIFDELNIDGCRAVVNEIDFCVKVNERNILPKRLYWANKEYYLKNHYQVIDATDFILVYNASKVLKEIE